MKPKKIKNKLPTSHLYSFLKTYWIHLLFLFFLANYGITRSLQLYFYAQSCLTKTQVAADSRCLYIYGNNVYEKGTKDRPHKGHTCGIDVTSFIPSFHIQDMSTYMDPGLVGLVCSDTPPTPTVVPPTTTPIPQLPTATLQPTTPPQATNTPLPNQPTNTPTTHIQQSNTQPTATAFLATKPSPTRKVLKPTITKIPTPTPTSMKLVSNQNSSGFGKFVSSQDEQQNPVMQQTNVNKTLAKSTTWSPIIMLSQSLVIASFLLVVIITVYGILKKIRNK